MTTKRQQQLEVSEGLALGMFLNGWGELPLDQPNAELKFRSAWRHWEHNHKFDKLGYLVTGPGSEYLTLKAAGEGSQTIWFYWEGRQLVVRRGDPIEDPEYIASVISDRQIPADEWRKLAYVAFSTYL